MDHVPPRQFYAPSLRKAHNLARLVTLTSHGACNRSYEQDEEYFTWSLSPMAVESTAGSALHRDRLQKLQRGRRTALFHMVRNEFDPRPSGLHLPKGRVVKRFSSERVTRVVWKLVRGLYFHEVGSVLPEDTPKMWDVVEPERARELAGKNAVWERVKAQPPRGAYGGVFEYKYFVGRFDDKTLHAWGMLLWDKIMIFVAHHDPGASRSNRRLHLTAASAVQRIRSFVCGRRK